MKLILAGLMILTAAAAYDAYRSRRQLDWVASRCVRVLLAKPMCAEYVP